MDADYVVISQQSKEEQTQEEYGSIRGVVKPWIGLLCEQTPRSKIRVEERTREHDNYDSELKDISQDKSASHRLQGAISFLMPDEEHLVGFPRCVTTLFLVSK